MISYLLYSASKDAGGTLLYDFTNRVQGLAFATNNRGMAECTAFVPLGLLQAFQIYDRPGLPFVYVVDTASATLFEGRLEDVTITNDGVKLGAFGQARALADLPYTAAWSVTGVQGWRVLTSDDITGTTKDKYTFDQQNRLYIGLTKNTVYTNASDFAFWAYQRPNGSSRSIIGIQFDLEMTLPLNWSFLMQSRDDSWGFIANVVTAGATGALQKFTYNTTFAAAGALNFVIFNNTGANYTMAGENGTFYAKVTNIRIVTTTTNRISTTLTANRNAGTNVTATVGSTARMYIGQQLQINSGAFGSETVTVLSIGSSTQFNATFVNNHVSTEPVQAHIVYGDEIVKDMVTTVTGTNSSQLATSTALIQSPGLDLGNEVYEDRSMADILDYLTGLGDNQITPRQWEWGVEVGRLLYFRPQSTAGQTWYIDVTDLNLERSLDQLVNSWYGVYKEAGGRALRTAAQADTTSIARYGLTRRQPVSADTTSSTLATTEAQAALADTKDPKSRSGLKLDRVYDANGSRWPLWYVQAGDTLIMRNLPPTLATTIDKIRSFRLSHTEYSADDDTLAIEPDVPAAKLDTLLARLAVANQQRKTSAPYQRWGGVITG